MSDIQWLESVEEEYVNLNSIIRVFVGHDKIGELLAVIGVTPDRSIHSFYTLPKLGEVVTAPKGDVVVTRKVANILVEKCISQISLFEGTILSRADLKTAIELDLEEPKR